MAETSSLGPRVDTGKAPGKEERTLLDLLDAMDGEGDSAKATASRHWTENLKLVKGEGQWRSQRASLFLMNIIRNQVERKVAQISESKPTFSVVSRLGHLSNASKILDATCKALLEEQDYPATAERLSRTGMQMGCAMITTEWQRGSSVPLGDIIVTARDPRTVKFDPAVTEAKNLDRDARYLILESPISLDELRELFPGRGALVKADDRYSTYTEVTGSPAAGGISSALKILPRVFRPRQSAKASPFPRVMLKQYWYRDPSTDLWPGGRRILRAGDVVLIDEKNPYWDGKFSLDMIDWSTDLDSAWGIDDIQDLKKLQEALNRLGDGIMRNALFNSQAWIIATTNALDAEGWGKITTEGGHIVKIRQGSEFRRDPPPALPAYMFQVLQAIPGMADLITGNSEVIRGRAAKTGIEAVVDGLQTAGSSLARMIARRHEALLQRVGNKIISRIIQCYGLDRLLHYYDPSGQLISYLFERQKFMLDDKGNPIPADELSKHYGKFRFLVQPYSSLAMTKLQRAQVLIGLWQVSGGRGVAFRRVLEAADIGDPDTLMEEAREELESGQIMPPMPPTKR